MKKKFFTKLLSIALVCVMMIMCMGAYNGEIIYESEDGYAELRHQFNFENIVFETNSEDQIKAKVNTNNLLKKIALNNDIVEINNLLQRYPEAAMGLKNSIARQNRIIAIGVTEAPLEYVNENFLRVTTRGYSQKEESAESSRYNFSLWTIVEKSFTGEYHTTTRGFWSTNGILSGEKYPDGGDDYILQTSPETFVRKSDYLTAWYSTNENGESGIEFWKENGGANYIRYAVDEEPFGLGYLENISLGVVSTDNGVPQNRIINSYYIHTWHELSISVSVSASSDREVSLEITPSIVGKSWQLYSYVSFNF